MGWFPGRMRVETCSVMEKNLLSRGSFVGLCSRCLGPVSLRRGPGRRSSTNSGTRHCLASQLPRAPWVVGAGPHLRGLCCLFGEGTSQALFETARVLEASRPSLGPRYPQQSSAIGFLPRCALALPKPSFDPCFSLGALLCCHRPLLSPSGLALVLLANRLNPQRNPHPNPDSTSSRIRGSGGLFPSLSPPASVFCFLLFFVRFIFFIPSKLPEQLMMSNYSGTLALFTFASKTEDVGRRNSKGESEAEGVEPGAGFEPTFLAHLASRCSAPGPPDRNHGRPGPASQDAHGQPRPLGTRLTSPGPHRDSQAPPRPRS